MGKRARPWLHIACFALLSPLSPAAASTDVEPGSLKYYSYCVSQAKDRNFVYVLDRAILYRCHDDVAVSYFNYLGSRHVPDSVVEEPGGTFVYRRISNLGRCWNKISDEYGRPVSLYGCEIYTPI